jgi:type II secretion system protein I
MRRSRHQDGFTLIEVIVALGIAAGALIALLSANNSSLSRSSRSRHDAKLEQALESKLDELRSGTETDSGGELHSCPGWQWRVDRESADVEDIKNLKRITCTAFNSNAHERVVKTVLIYDNPRQKK